jgi:Ca2+/Na+ antiporter
MPDPSVIIIFLFLAFLVVLVIAFLTMDTSVISVSIFLFFILLVPLLLYKNQWNKRIEKEKKEHEEAERKRLEEKFSLIKSNICEEINRIFLIPKCSRCNDINFKLIRFNTQLNGIECECKTCNKTFWIKAEQSISKSIYNEYIESKFSGYFSPSPIILISNYNINNYSKDRHHIPSSVKDKVWNRDGGKCVKCGSQKNLEFDHIIPISKGGSNTARNIQLLCEKCNRSKGSKVV